MIADNIEQKNARVTVCRCSPLLCSALPVRVVQITKNTKNGHMRENPKIQVPITRYAIDV